MGTIKPYSLIPIILGLILPVTAQVLPVWGQDLQEPDRVIPLYEGVAPGSESWDWEENAAVTPTGLPMVQNVVSPAIMYYPPDPGTDVGTAMVIAPGGGFRNLMMSYEGIEIARYLNQLGVHAFVLKYRLFRQEEEAPQQKKDVRQLAAADGQQAIRLVRGAARDMGFDEDRVGMIGFSAGGYVTMASVFGPADGRPDFAVPVYAAVGREFGLPLDVPENAPPLCIFTSANDQIIPWEKSVELFTAWKEAGFVAEIHIFQTGRHGFVEEGGGADHYLDRMQEWMKVNGWLNN